MQEQAGEQEMARRTGVIVRPEITSGAIAFLREQRTVAVGSLDRSGAAWASLLFGTEGFVSTEDGSTVVLDRALLTSSPEDPLVTALRVGAFVGLLPIDFATRQRLRVNGVVSATDARSIRITVRESYPNCRKYVQRRVFRESRDVGPVSHAPCVHGAALDAVRHDLVEAADTFFVSSVHPERGVDVSHRGGAPGFVRVEAPDVLRIPDYSGNSMFNTLGNFAVDDRAGLVFVDFEGGRLLRMTGTAWLAFGEREDPRQPTGGTGRYWYFRIARWAESPMVASASWNGLEPSSHNPR